MDLTAGMLNVGLRRLIAKSNNGKNIAYPQQICPPFKHRLVSWPIVGVHAAARNADRLLNRFWDYPRYVRRRVARTFDLYHVADHSYSQLVHQLPSSTTGVFCHDLDTFKCLLEPQSERRPRWFRAMATHILKGMKKAAIVFHSTIPVRDEILRHGLINPDRLVRAPYGISSEFQLNPSNDDSLQWKQWDPREGPSFLLHVGSCIPRKRIDVLLDVFRAVQNEQGGLRLIQVGGTFTPEQQERIERRGIGNKIVQMRGLSRHQLAALYRRASLVLQTSEAEGFGLPIIEALACGANVIASDIPVLREVAGPAAVYCPVGDVSSWAATVSAVLDRRQPVPSLDSRLAWSLQYTWEEHARRVGSAYLRLLEGKKPGCLV